MPFDIEAMRLETGLYVEWYNERRPHQSLGGVTPQEVYEARARANGGARLEPRARYPASGELRGRAGERLQLKVDYLEGRRHLPIVELERVA